MKNYITGLIAASAAVAAFAQETATKAAAAATNAATNAAAAGTNLLTNGATAGTNTTPGAAASTAAKSGGSDWLPYLIWGAVIAAIFGFLWSKGYLIKIRNYVEETKEELRKCSWPSKEELKGSTVVVMVTILILGLFTVGVDWILSNVIRLIT